MLTKILSAEVALVLPPPQHNPIRRLNRLQRKHIFNTRDPSIDVPVYYSPREHQLADALILDCQLFPAIPIHILDNLTQRLALEDQSPGTPGNRRIRIREA